MEEKNGEKFDYTYHAPTEEERREIEDIRKRYLPKEKSETKLDKLRRLEKLVNLPPKIAGAVTGVAGTLILGVGMTMFLEWEILAWGIVVGVLGLAVAAAAYPIYKAILRRNKERYSQEILNLTDELLNK